MDREGGGCATKSTTLKETQSGVEREDLLAAAETLVPSVSAQELQHYERLAQEYNDLASS